MPNDQLDQKSPPGDATPNEILDVVAELRDRNDKRRLDFNALRWCSRAEEMAESINDWCDETGRDPTEAQQDLLEDLLDQGEDWLARTR